MNDAIQQFKVAMAQYDIEPPEHVCDDGVLHRFGPKLTGWYVFHSDGVPAGSFGDWKTGVNQKWHANIGRKLTADEEATHRKRMEIAQQARDQELEKSRAEAARKANKIWQEAEPVDTHPYLKTKQVHSYGLRVYEGKLAIPLQRNGAITSLQLINEDGSKRFLTGGQKSGCYFSIGELADAETICIAEGYATAASIHESIGFPVVVAFDAGNLKSVTEVIRKAHPLAKLMICADDDYKTEGNPGLTKAREAAKLYDATVVVPQFGADRPDGATDFNDLASYLGIDAVADCFLDIDGQPAATCQSLLEAEFNAPSENLKQNAVASVTDVTKPSCVTVADSELPVFKIFDAVTMVTSLGKLPAGVWYFGPGKPDSEDTKISARFICSPIHVEAVTHDGHQNNFGRMLRFQNTLGIWRSWAMPMELLRGRGEELRGELLSMGALIDPSAHQLLGRYLQDKTPERQVLCALQVGWCGKNFVLPDEVIGEDASEVIFQSGERTSGDYTVGGTFEGWKSGIAALAIGNPLLILAISASFAGPILSKCNSEGGGIHFVGDSSTGKTTAIEAACSIWGGRDFKRSWRSTSNGMEGAAVTFNDCLLALDEISECDPREVGAITYALSNGYGKQRASKTGAARRISRWRCFVLSSGERTIETTMLEGGHRTKAGQAVRLLDIPTARKFGAWDELHEFQTGTALSDAIKRTVASHFGHAGRLFLHKLTRDNRDFCEYLERIKALANFRAADGEGQDKRAAARFALLALAGELATEYGITGWPEGAAIEGATIGFDLWRGNRGTGNDERRKIVQQLNAFIDRHGDSRFSELSKNGDVIIRDRAGWWKEDGSSRVYWFSADGLREALKGFDFKSALDVLQMIGILPASKSSGERAQSQRVAGRVVKVYPIHADKLGG